MKKIYKFARVFILLMFNTGAALYLSGFYSQAVKKMEYICAPSCMDVIVSCLNEYNTQIITGAVILLNTMSILGQYDKNIFLLKFGSVKRYKSYINKKIIIQSAAFSLYFFAAVLIFSILNLPPQSGYALMNWNLTDSYFCFVNHSTADMGVFACLTAVYLSILLKWILTAEYFCLLYGCIRKRTISFLIVTAAEYWSLRGLSLSLVPIFKREYAAGGFYIANIMIYAGLALLLMLINVRAVNRQFIMKHDGGLNEHRN